MIRLADAVKAVRLVKVDHARKFAQHVVPEVVRPARIIWNQAIGLIFLVLAFGALSQATKFYRSLQSDPNSAVRLAICLVFGVPMLMFGVSSFLRARRISRR